MFLTLTLVASLAVQDLGHSASDEDWRGFRGTDTSGVSSDEGTPVEWDDEANVLWKVELPGPGSSSPIVVGEKVLLTCWTGYGLSREEPGDPKELRRQLLCLDREDGSTLWSKEVGPAEKEDPYKGRITSHGYASNTPVTDGTNVYVFYGKRGVLAYDLEGEELWHEDMGGGSSEWNTGSSGSLLLCGDVLVVNAADESDSIRGLNKHTGDELWRVVEEGLDLAFGMPVVATHEGETVVVFALLEAIWGLSPTTGEKVWTVKTETNGAVAPIPVVKDGIVYSLGGQTGKRGYAIRLGGQGDVTETHVKWSIRWGSYVPSPVLVDEHLYWVDDSGMAHCADAESGEIVYRERLGSAFYSSVIAAGDLLYAVSRDAGTYVLPAAPDFEVIAHNVFEGDDTNFDACPAVSRDQLFLRSGKYCYCLEEL